MFAYLFSIEKHLSIVWWTGIVWWIHLRTKMWAPHKFKEFGFLFTHALEPPSKMIKLHFNKTWIFINTTTNHEKQMQEILWIVEIFSGKKILQMFEIFMEFLELSFYLLSRFFFPILFATQSWIVLPQKKKLHSNLGEILVRHLTLFSTSHNPYQP